jgi:hypothetical protein
MDGDVDERAGALSERVAEAARAGPVARLPSTWSRKDFATVIAREHEHLELTSGAAQAALQRAMVAFSNIDGGVVSHRGLR